MTIARAVLLVGSAKPAGTSTSEVLGRYLCARLAERGVATTVLFVGRSPGLRLVAVKVIRPDHVADPGFRARLLADPWAAADELGLATGPGHSPIVVLENTAAVHNVVVCTLCSCYPSSLLGLPPTWYKSPPYRSRVVREPRFVLREMGCELPPDVEVRVWDSSAEVRYMVLPARPAGTDGWTEEQLAQLLTRDALIGVARPEVAREK